VRAGFLVLFQHEILRSAKWSPLIGTSFGGGGVEGQRCSLGYRMFRILVPAPVPWPGQKARWCGPWNFCTADSF
jgi:hypothetical protein